MELLMLASVDNGYNLTTFTAGFGSNQPASFHRNSLNTGLYFNISGIL